MKIQKLQMQEFMVYRDETIDFTRFQNGKLFLVTGATGSGKTTIFDAICFAFYGNASTEGRGKGRDEGLVSKLEGADPTKNAVSVWFSVKGKNYLVTRRAKHQRMTRRNTLATQDQTVDLYEIVNGTQNPIGESKTERDKILQELVGLDLEQFRKIVMLPQAEFSEFLKASSQKKEEILKRIFPIDIYTRFTEKTKALLQQEEADWLGLQNRLRGLWSARTRFDTTVSTPEFSESWGVALDEERGYLQERKKESATLDAALKDREQKVLEINANRANAKQHNEQVKLFQTAEEALILSEKQLPEMTSLQKDLQLLKASESVVIREEQSVKEEESLKRAKDNWELAKRDCVEKKKALQASVTAFIPSLSKADLQNTTSDFREEQWAALLQEDIRKSQEEESRIEEKERHVTREVGDLRVVYQSLNSALQSMRSIQTTMLERDQLRLSIPNAKRDWENARIQLEECDQKLRLSGLSQYADQLDEGKPCPLCGSTSHPVPYHADASLQHRFEVAKRTFEERERVYNQLLASEESKRGSLSTYQNNARETYESIWRDYQHILTQYEPRSPFENHTPWKRIEFVENVLEQLLMRGKDGAKTQAEILIEKERIKEAIATLHRNERTLQELQAAISIADHAEKNASNSVLEQQERSDASKQAFAFEWRKYFSDLHTYRALIERKSELEGLSQDVEDFFEKRKRDQQTTEVLQSWRGKALIDLQKLDAELTSALQDRDQLDQRLRTLQSSIEKDRSLFDQIEGLFPEIEKKEKRKSMLRALFDLINGSKAGLQNQRITLESFVLGAYFDRILAYANMRLATISEGKYQLARREEATSGNSKQGLDIEIIDNTLSVKREPSSLSGGETFFVSLSLALGLADEVSNSKGTFELEHLFIDEGFGSLDPDTLQSAMYVLKGMSQGDKLIGIISHVEAFKNEIENRIEVTKHADGSATTRMEVL